MSGLRLLALVLDVPGIGPDFHGSGDQVQIAMALGGIGDVLMAPPLGGLNVGFCLVSDP
ncbi:hypothetical protein [Streptomyces sp. NPDC059819]|uniref:hypothetical protein n=1 Tax=Streptomyces sp. NPDC059819 TaxID=3346963 RepID=UPI00364E7637